MKDIFVAHSYHFGTCDNPRCTAIHLDLMDEHGVVQAQAVIPMRRMEEFARALLCESNSKHVVVN